MSEFCCLQIPHVIFEVDADPMCRRPCPDKAEPAGGKAKPDIWQIRKIGPPVFCLIEIDLRQGLR
jgi:hypothetical protein